MLKKLMFTNEDSDQSRNVWKDIKLWVSLFLNPKVNITLQQRLKIVIKVSIELLFTIFYVSEMLVSVVSNNLPYLTILLTQKWYEKETV